MYRAQFPVLFRCSNVVRAKLGRELDRAVVLALKAVLVQHGTLEVAHQQITYRQHHLAFSTRIGREGDLIVELDEGDASLSGRIVLEDEIRRAERARRDADYDARHGRRGSGR